MKEEMKQNPEGFSICSSRRALIPPAQTSPGTTVPPQLCRFPSLCVSDFQLSQTDNRRIGLNRRIVTITNSEGHSSTLLALMV